MIAGVPSSWLLCELESYRVGSLRIEDQSRVVGILTYGPMATYTPPPYFPQSSLSPPDKNRYLKFKLVVAALIVLLLAIIGGAITGIVYLYKALA